MALKSRNSKEIMDTIKKILGAPHRICGPKMGYAHIYTHRGTITSNYEPQDGTVVGVAFLKEKKNNVGFEMRAAQELQRF